MKFILVFLTAGVLFSSSLHSAITVYTDRTAWINAAGGTQIFSVNFNSYTTDVAATGAVDIGPFTLTPSGDWNVIPLIDTPQGGFWNSSVGGTSGVTLYALTGVRSLLVSFDNQVGSFGFDLADSFGTGSGVRRALITTSAGDSHQFLANPGSVGFIGLVSTSGFNSVNFTSGDNVRPQIDNFEAYSFSGIPEPTAGALLFFGAGVLVLIRRRKV